MITLIPVIVAVVLFVGVVGTSMWSDARDTRKIGDYYRAKYTRMAEAERRAGLR